MKTEIFIARHGQNVDNVNNILNGHRDLPLTDVGREQARELGMGIRALGLNFDAVYTSPLIRAKETAEIAAKLAHLPTPIVAPDLIERDFGEMTGRPIPEVAEICKDDLLHTDGVSYMLSDEYGFETFDKTLERARSVIEQMRTEHDGEKVLLVCHGDIGKMLYAAAANKEWVEVLKNFHFGNGDLIDVKGESAHVIKLPQHQVGN